jgi:hypothetical protein
MRSSLSRGSGSEGRLGPRRAARPARRSGHRRAAARRIAALGRPRAARGRSLGRDPVAPDRGARRRGRDPGRRRGQRDRHGQGGVGCFGAAGGLRADDVLRLGVVAVLRRPRPGPADARGRRGRQPRRDRLRPGADACPAARDDCWNRAERARPLRRGALCARPRRGRRRRRARRRADHLGRAAARARSARRPGRAARPAARASLSATRWRRRSAAATACRTAS